MFSFSDHFLNFGTIAAKSGGHRLQSLLQKAKYPLEIRVAPEAGVKFNIDKEKRRIFDFGSLTINSADDIYEETFIKGNGVREGRELSN